MDVAARALPVTLRAEAPVQVYRTCPLAISRCRRVIVECSVSRRHAALGTAIVLSTAAAGGPAEAVRTVTLRDGTEVQAFEHGMSISIVALRGSVPDTWAVEFKTSIGKYCGFSLDQRGQLQDIFKELSDASGKKQRSAGLADVVTLGDGWLAAAIASGLVQPIPGARSCRWWGLLPPRLQQLARRDARGRVSASGEVYGAPYRWGCTLIAYRRDKLLRRGGRPILDWSDLLQPLLQGKVAMLDSPRELLAAALRSLQPEVAPAGPLLSVNATPAQLAAAGVSEDMLRERVAALRRQVKLFSNRDHIRAMHAGDVWAVVGSSQDLVTYSERGSDVELVAPLSGTQLWADTWAVPAGARGGDRQVGPSPLLPVWIEFSLSPGRITGTPGLKAGAPAATMDAQWPPTSASASGSGSGGAGAQQEPQAAEVLAAIQSHREHLEQRRRAAADAGPVATLIASGRAKLAPVLERLTGGSGEQPAERQQGGEGASGRVVAAWDADAGGRAAAAAGVEADAASDAVDGRYPDVLLDKVRGYLPPGVVLARSEFLEPLDEAALAMYRRVLAG